MYDEYVRYKRQRDAALQKIQKIIKDTISKENNFFIAGKTKIPLMTPSISWPEINEAMDSIMKTEFTMGKKVRRFEKDYAKYMGTKEAVMVNSGSSANLLALSVLTNPRKSDRVKAGEEVICPAIGWSTTFFPMVYAGLIPVYVDIELGTYDIDVEKAEEAVTKKSSIIMPVHLAGNPCEMDRICEIAEKHDLYLIEDTCEAHGSEFKGKKTGSFGDVGTFSFYMSHHITTGEGGMLITNDNEIAEIARNLRAFGWVRDMNSKKRIEEKYKELDKRFIFYNLGYNIRPTEIAGSFGIHQLKKIRKNIAKRKSNAKYWLSTLKQFEDVLIMPKTTKNASHVWFGFPLTVRPEAPFTRNQIVSYLEKKGIETRPIMSGNMADHPSIALYKHRIHKDLPNARLVTRNGFFFGNYPQMSKEAREYISKTIAEFINEKTKK